MCSKAEHSPTGLPTDEAVDRLAAILFWKMEHLDPDDDYDWDKDRESNWRALDGHSKSYYRACISMLATEPELWMRATSRAKIRQLPLCRRGAVINIVGCHPNSLFLVKF